MIIKYTNFSDGIHYINFEEPAEKLGLDSIYYGMASIECRMDKSAHQIVLDCDIKLQSKMICDRCNEEYESIITPHFQMGYIFSRDSNIEESLNLRYLSPEEDRIDISKDVIEYSELAVPMKRLCSDDCKGLCSMCGINLNVKKCKCKKEIKSDIWEPLQKLKLNN